MIRLEEALKIILSKTRTLPPEKVEISSSLERVLAEDVYADFDIPGFDRSAMDGYAVMAEDTSSARSDRPLILEVIADLPAGYQTRETLKEGKAVRIMTGAPLPQGADAVVMVEDTQEEEDRVRIFRKVKPGENVSFAGEDVKKGELVLKEGSLIRPAEVGMLAALGKEKVMVRKKPTVAIISTGDELAKVGDRLKEGQIYDSNSFALFSQVRRCGAIPQRLGIAPDKIEELTLKIQEGLSFHILLLSGGVSVGVYDLVKEATEEAGVEILFWKVAVKPGKPTFFGIRDHTLVFGLPGYPVSSMLNFENLVKPAIYAMLGRKERRIRVEAYLESSVRSKGKRRNFIRVKLVWHGGEYRAVPASSQKSGVLKSMVWADGFIVVPEEIDELKKGERVQVQLLD
jgi:molybdopterin molybdotransferase